MKAKDKARELVDRFRDYSYEYEVINSEEDTQDWNAKQCALICVDKQIKLLANLSTYNPGDAMENAYQMELELEQIKKEINKL